VLVLDHQQSHAFTIARLLSGVSGWGRHDEGMSLFTHHPRARWAAPGAAVAVIAATALVADHTASADPSLPPRSAAQLLVDLQRAQVAGLSGTVVQTSNLGLPELPGAGGSGRDSSSLSSLVTGTHTWRVWYAGPTKARLALVGSLGESDVIRNGSDLWVWSSRDKAATHATLPAGERPKPKPTDLPKTPEEAAQLALAAIDPTTSVTTSGTGVVAGRPAYELVLRPKDSGSLVSQVRISIDATEHLPLRVQVYSTKVANPAFEVGFTQVDFGTPDADRFVFNPPPGTTVTEAGQLKHEGTGSRDKAGERRRTSAEPTVVGKGWSTVVVAKLPERATQSGTDSTSLERFLSSLRRVSGPWGSGRLLNGTLFSAVLTDDGRIAVGAVAPERLYAALAAK
jgi:outer membrane lipoprotein-sorting protein